MTLTISYTDLMSEKELYALLDALYDIGYSMTVCGDNYFIFAYVANDL